MEVCISHRWLFPAVCLVVGLRLTACADEPTQQYNAASGFFRMNRFDFAADEYEKFLADFPKHELVPEAVYFLAESYYQLNRLEDARGRFREVATKHTASKNHAYALYRLGETSQMLGDHAAAEAALAEFVAKRPTDPLVEFALPKLGGAQVGLAKWKEAKETLQKALGKFPKGRLRDQTQYDLARALKQLNEKDAAVALYRAVAANSASKLADDAQLAVGTQFFEDKNYESAAAAFLELEQKFAGSPWIAAARLNRALCLYQLQRFDAAQAILDAQVRGDGAAVPEAWYWLGMTQRARGQHAAAAKTLTEGHTRFAASSIAPEMAFHAAQSMFQQSDFAAARDRFLDVADKFPKHELADDGLYYAAEAARSLGEHDRVFELAARLYKSSPQSALVDRMNLTVGQSLIAGGRHDEAAAQLVALVARKPDPAIALPTYYYLAVAQHASGRVDDAIKSLEPLLAESNAAGSDPAIAAVRTDAQYLAGSCYFEKKDYARAVPLLEKYLAARPRGDMAGHAHSYLAVSFASLGQFDKLRGTLEGLRGAAAKDLSMPAIFRVAEACYDAQQFELAGTLYAEVAERDAGPLRPKAMSGVGWTNYQQNKFAAAAAAFAQLVDAHPTDPFAAEAVYMRGRALEADAKPADAAEAYRSVLAKYADSAQAFDAGLQLARLLQKTGKPAESAAAYEDLTKRHAKARSLDTALYEWAWVLQQDRRDADARRVFERLVSDFPQSPLVPEAVFHIGESQFQSKQYGEVVARLGPLLERQLAPQVREAVLYRLGRTQIELAAWANAQSAFEQLLKEFPQSPLRREAELWTAEAEREQGRAKAAVDRLTRLIAEPAGAEPWLGAAYLRLAQSHGELKQWKEVLAAIEQLKKRFPNFELSSVADYHAGRAMQNLGRFDEARDQYRRAIAGRSDENAAKSQFMIGETYFHQKRFQEALREFLKVEILYAFPQWQSGALLEAAKCHESLQEWPRAAETYNRIIEKYPKSPHAAEASERRAAALKKVTAGISSKN